jgi:hypothetical protein
VTLPRDVLRERIAAALRSCPSGRFNIPTMADAVMELFPDVGVEDWLIATMPGTSGDVEVREQIRRPHMPVTHRRYVLRTTPEEVPS